VGEHPPGRLLPLTAAAVYARWIRLRLLSWGATRDEATRGYPGDELTAAEQG